MSDVTEAAEIVKPRNKGGRPRKVHASPSVDAAALMQTPEIQTAIAQAVAAATADILARLSEKRATENTVDPGGSSGDVSFARVLATQIADIADQGAKTKRVAPAEMEKRRFARERMEGLLIEAAARDESVEYELTRAQYLAETFVEPTYVDPQHVRRRTKIAWPHVPNEGMHPLNERAKEIFAAFIESIGGATPNASQHPANGSLKVLHKPEGAEAPQVGRPRNPDLKILGRATPGEIIETAVLGTIAAPARQMA